MKNTTWGKVSFIIITTIMICANSNYVLVALGWGIWLILKVLDDFLWALERWPLIGKFALFLLRGIWWMEPIIFWGWALPALIGILIGSLLELVQQIMPSYRFKKLGLYIRSFNEEFPMSTNIFLTAFWVVWDVIMLCGWLFIKHLRVTIPITIIVGVISAIIIIRKHS